MFMIWETFWRHRRSKNKFRRLVCLSANFEMHNLASFFWWVFYFSLIWEHLDPFKKNKRVSLIKKMVLKHLGDEIWPTLCLVKGSIENRGFRFLWFLYFRFLRFLVSSVIGSVSEILVRFPVSGSVSIPRGPADLVNKIRGISGKSGRILFWIIAWNWIFRIWSFWAK